MDKKRGTRILQRIKMSNFTHELHKHRLLLKGILNHLANELKERAEHHDDSKYDKEEKDVFEIIDNIRREDFDTYEEYYNCTKPLVQKALDHHYSNNRHHPEHFEKGVNDMNLLDILEMVVDWDTSASCRGTKLDVDYSFKRFKIEPQLQKIIINTLKLINPDD